MAEWQFTTRDDGIVEVDLGSDWPGFTEALNDSVTTRAPQGHSPGLSAYWIDRTLDALDSAQEPGTPIASGNGTSLILGDGVVVAHSDYDVWEDEPMPIDAFVSGMNAWRTRTMSLLG